MPLAAEDRDRLNALAPGLLPYAEKLRRAAERGVDVEAKADMTVVAAARKAEVPADLVGALRDYATGR